LPAALENPEDRVPSTPGRTHNATGPPSETAPGQGNKEGKEGRQNGSVTSGKELALRNRKRALKNGDRKRSPEVTDPFCRLPLPTLFHWPEAVHLGDLMRYEYDRAWTVLGPPDFQGPPGAHRTPRDVRCSSDRWTLPPAEPIPV